jgi:hypothetical protein
MNDDMVASPRDRTDARCNRRLSRHVLATARMTPMDKIRRGGKSARPIALTMRAEMFEAMMAMSYAALVAALVALVWQG